eukprot:CAMPEP_0118709934 /NCGR_PEP_ID=MMETSP0800-20121206/23011_1 /TAXON_ID=210618 ORGANISM="Striatella unipunctata, Strain CCMP2910" /NCGR_SAMPLE_ID=MMETSP0800 /ASSEMBLY_ACC=CAM_ASM_000638 /LENGTH=54 /DNA_ID=CAMNT_0006613879 /DNA_START=31 /DNA_END=192 /DNA_ORIENTATION=+
MIMRDHQPESSNDDDDHLEMAEFNMDWSATAAIYVEESKVLPILSDAEPHQSRQ